MAFVFNGSEISSPPPPIESTNDNHMLPPIPKSRSSPMKHKVIGDDADDYEDEATMPKEYYADIDQFLSIDPPSLKSIMKNQGPRANISHMKNERSKLRKNKSAPAGSSIPVARSQRRFSAGANGRKQQGKNEKFNYDLLAEAMKFTDDIKLQSEVITQQGDSTDDRPDRLAGGSPPRQGNPLKALRRRKSSEKMSEHINSNKGNNGNNMNNTKKNNSKDQTRNSSVYDTQRQKKSNKNKPTKKTNSAAAFENGDQVSNDKSEMDSMVQNFEQGLELSRLRAELAASQQRMQNSTSVITAAASEFYQAPNNGPTPSKPKNKSKR